MGEGNVDDFGTSKSEKKDNVFFQITTNKPTCQEVENEEVIDTKVPPPTYVQWSEISPNTYSAVSETKKQLDSGVYIPGYSHGKPFLRRQVINVDELIQFKDSIFENVLIEIDKFWTLGENFKTYNFLHRRGLLFYGPPGSGKSALVQLIIADIIKRGGIVVLGENPEAVSDSLWEFRQVEPDRHIVVIFEDIDSIIDTLGDDKLLSFLDGEIQINKILNIATTNFPEKLDKRIVARPRRFDNLIKIGMPPEGIRREYFNKKLKIGDGDLEKWVTATKDFSFAAMAELVISVKCLNNDFDKTVERLSKLMKQTPTSADWEDGVVGFKKAEDD